jgi:hypothetical protein
MLPLKVALIKSFDKLRTNGKALNYVRGKPFDILKGSLVEP